jgi:uncharacterized protein (DUF488 family)
LPNDQATFDLFTIGHSNHPIDHFVALLRGADVTALADVRSQPFSRRSPWFSAGTLGERLATEGIAYVPLGDALGGRPRDPALLHDGVPDYAAMAATPEFRAGIDRVIEGTRRFRVCLMCAERDPLACHRCLLVAPAFAERGLRVGHVLADGSIVAHAEIEQSLLAVSGDLFDDPARRHAPAPRRRGRAGAIKPS